MKKIAGLPLQFWVVTSIAFINAVSFTIIIPVIYPYAKQFGLSDFQASLLTTVYAGCQFIGTPILGSLSDRFGRKPLLILSLLGTVAANLIASLTPIAWLLFFARALDGLTGGNTSVARAVISDITNREERTRAFGIFGATFRLGFVAGPPLSYLAQTLPPPPESWPLQVSPLGASFLVAGSTALIATILCWLFLPETYPREKKTFSLGIADFGFYKIAKSVRRDKFNRIFLLTFLSGFAFTIFTFAFQPFFLTVLDQTPKRLAIVFAAIGVLGFLSQILALDPLLQRFSPTRLLSVTMATRSAVFFLLPLFSNITAFSVLILVFGFVNSFPLPIIDSAISLRSSDREQGEMLGVNAACLSLANALGPATSGLLVSLGYGAPLWVAGILTFGTAIAALSLLQPVKAEG